MNTTSQHNVEHAAALDLAADAIRRADAMLVTAGAGMGVDSGLPDFRGPEGFWRAYPPYRAMGLRFEQLANPAAFARDPHLAWGFYGHRMNLYRATEPHGGFQILRRWGESKPGGCFVFTSNVDGHFQRAGFSADRVVECHGSILHLQCMRPCTEETWPVDGIEVELNSALRARDPIPHCAACRGLARPNILMFGDGDWLDGRTRRQKSRYQRWLSDATADESKRLVIIECGAGTGIPTVRHESEWALARRGATLVRINLREAPGPAGIVSLPMAALAALEAISSRIG